MAKDKSLPMQAAEQIRRYIEENSLQVGDKLPNEFQLAEYCNVGRSSIREAIKLLTYEGIVEVVRGSGTYIRNGVDHQEEQVEDPFGLFSEKNKAKTALEFMDARLLLEPEIAASAAMNATKSDCQKLKEIHVRLKNNVEMGKDHIQEDIEFHRQIAKCSGNDIYYKIMEIMTNGIPTFIELTRNKFASETVMDHEAILNAIISGDTIGAKCNMVVHLNSNRGGILEYLNKDQ